jgi:hypothetical protein
MFALIMITIFLLISSRELTLLNVTKFCLGFLVGGVCLWLDSFTYYLFGMRKDY